MLKNFFCIFFQYTFLYNCIIFLAYESEICISKIFFLPSSASNPSAEWSNFLQSFFLKLGNASVRIHTIKSSSFCNLLFLSSSLLSYFHKFFLQFWGFYSFSFYCTFFVISGHFQNFEICNNLIFYYSGPKIKVVPRPLKIVNGKVGNCLFQHLANSICIGNQNQKVFN